MPGSAIPVNTTAPPDPAFPSLRDDEILTTGSLALHQLDHSANPVTGIPSVNVANTIPNHAWRFAQALLPGAPSQTALAAGMASSTYPDGTRNKIERTTKGGLHIAMSAGPNLGQGAAALFAQPVVDWLVSNPTHVYYYTLWGRITRIGDPNDAPSVFAPYNATSATNTFWIISPDGNNYPSAAPGRVNATRVPAGVWKTTGGNGLVYPQPMRVSIAFTQGPSAPDLSGALARAKAVLFRAGFVSGTPNTAGNNASDSHSYLWYRSYLEDLTISGRSFAAVDGQDATMFGKQVTTAGGRYFGDTFTNPTTLPTS